MSTRSLKVATYNCNSIRARLDLVLAWLEREGPDILCLQETKVTDEDFPAEPFQERAYHVACHGRKAHGGVAFLSRQEPRSVVLGLEGVDEPDEGRLIAASFDGQSVVNTYVPQGRSPDSSHFQHKLQWLDALRSYFEQHYTPEYHLLWAGDFNVAPEDIDVYDPKRLAKHVDFHPDARAALEKVREWGFVDLFRLHHPDEAQQYSFWDYRVPQALERGMGWRVDHIWATEYLADKCTDCSIDVQPRRAEKPSDHTFVVARFDL